MSDILERILGRGTYLENQHARVYNTPSPATSATIALRAHVNVVCGLIIQVGRRAKLNNWSAIQ